MAKRQKIVKVLQHRDVPRGMTRALEDGYLVVRSDVIPGFQIENPKSSSTGYIGCILYILEKMR